MTKFVIGRIFFSLLVILVWLGSSEVFAQEEPHQGPTVTLPAGGKLVDMGGYQLHYLSSGPDNGQPVLFFHGAGDPGLIWRLVMDHMPENVRSIAFDAPGTAWSESGSLNRTIRQNIFDYHRLMEKEGITGPFVLVGQLFGGLYALEFARQYRDQVSARVLVSALMALTTSMPSGG